MKIRPLSILFWSLAALFIISGLSLLLTSRNIPSASVAFVIAGAFVLTGLNKQKQKPNSAYGTGTTSRSRKPMRIKCDYCGQFSPYGELKCVHCGGTLDYADKTDIVYEYEAAESAPAAPRAAAISPKQRAALAKRAAENAARTQKTAKRIGIGCLIAFAIIVVIVSIRVATSNRVNSTPPTPRQVNDTPTADVSPDGVNVISAPVVFEKAGIKITVSGFKDGDYLGEGLAFVLENNTRDTISVRSLYAVVNGITVGTHSIWEDVAAGKSLSDVIYFYQNDDGWDNIGIFKTIELVFQIKDSAYNTLWDCEHISVACNPDAPNESAEPVDLGREVLDRAGIKIHVSEITTRDSSYALVVYLAVLNTNEKDISIEVTGDSFAVNGTPITSYDSTYCAAGTVSYFSISLSKLELSEAGISKVGSIEAGFEIRELDENVILFVSEAIALTE
ncbi:MAG: hypothetical protein LBO63_07550 [Oscillospiraceae bacterium]|jgi:hypothetical protein|nr:hypothetical protein [Oscillospiraceae bacterium]